MSNEKTLEPRNLIALMSRITEHTNRMIVEELNAVQGKPADIGGYYLPDAAKLDAVMRPSATFNAALAVLA